MILPPRTPINGKHTFFELLCQMAEPVLNIKLDFEGYNELIDKYMKTSELDSNANFELSKEFIGWLEYFSDVANYIQNEFLNAETEKLQVVSEKSILSNEKNVSAGDRKANADPDVIIARKRRNILKSLYDSLVSHQDFCEKAFYHCKYNCMELQPERGVNHADKRY